MFFILLMAVVGMLSCYTTTLLLYTVKALRCLEQLNMVTQNSLKKYAINIVLVYPCLEEEGLYCLTLVVFPPSIQNKNLHCNFLSNYRMQRPDILHIVLSHSIIWCRAILCSLVTYFLFTEYFV